MRQGVPSFCVGITLKVGVASLIIVGYRREGGFVREFKGGGAASGAREAVDFGFGWFVSWTQSATSSSPSSKSKVLQVNPMTRPACDPEKQGACAKSSDDLITCDQIRNKSPDTSRVPTHNKS
jgi:hypothetical protein